MMQALLSNPQHPEYGVATIPFPIALNLEELMMEGLVKEYQQERGRRIRESTRLH